MKLIALATAIAVTVIYLVMISGAYAHDWYSGLQNEAGQYCCGSNDCAEIADQYVTPMKNGYQVHVPDFFGLPVDGFVPNARAKPAKQGGNYHMCVVGGVILCFFYPAPSF